ncbi:FHA domain-containing protein [Denitromonas iodatirespirans]|uniref:FHA domain-containing protein n=1 Tax=Denitromonas iodatirespirans TaxID=2795389 RepID=A0A944D968_DENI1|nr:FHA domain-containing protein [Denitromonas iodatirespirans]MBT0960681.1 FHA domain-containing protein [Denitromonas iodatirespirans]
MFSKISESRMRRIRYGLLLAWIGLLALYVVDIGQNRLTVPGDAWYVQGLAGKAVNLRHQVLLPTDYNPAPRIFWGVAIPLVVLFLGFAGHDAWRRICPLSALSQIPRALGLQRKVGRGDQRRPALIPPDSWFARYALVLQFLLFFVGVTLRLTVISANPELLFGFTLVLFAAALLVGFLYGGKTWCHYFCPMNAVQIALSGPRGLNASKPVAGISQSMCRKSDANGDVSTCVGCISACPDIDIEKSYWDRLPKLDQRFVVYGYLGTVLGFIHGMYATAGGFNYGTAVWYDTDWRAVGFAPWGTWLPIPRLLGASLLMVFWIVLAAAVGLLAEKLMQRWSHDSQADTVVEMSRHRTMTLTTLLAVLLLIYQVALPGMVWLPKPVVGTLGVVSTIALAFWAYRSWQRTSQRHQRESLADSMRRHLHALRSDWSEHLNGRQLDALSADEIHLLTSLVPKLESSNRLAFYQALLADVLHQGNADSIEGRTLLAKVRTSCGISDQEHEAIVGTLKDEYDIRDNLLISSSLRMESFRRQLEKLLYSTISQGQPLTEALREHHDSICRLREDVAISEHEEAQVIEGLTSKSGPLVETLHALFDDLRDIHAKQLTLAPGNPSRAFLHRHLQREATKVAEECLGIVETLDESPQFFVDLAGELLSKHESAVRNALLIEKSQWRLRLPEPFWTALDRPTDGAIERLEAYTLNQVLHALAHAEDPCVALVAAYEAQWQGLAWADAINDRLWPQLGRSAPDVTPRPLGMSLSIVGFANEHLSFDGTVRCGRAPDNDWVVQLGQISRYHFRLVKNAQGYRCEDLNSCNGTFLNGRLLHGQSAPLKKRNTLSILSNGQTAIINVHHRREADFTHPLDLMVTLAGLPLFVNCPSEALFKLADGAELRPTHAGTPIPVHALSRDFTVMLLDTSGALLLAGKRHGLPQGLPVNSTLIHRLTDAWLDSDGNGTLVIWPNTTIDCLSRQEAAFNNQWLTSINRMLQEYREDPYDKSQCNQ